jgi:hypothetical protein
MGTEMFTERISHRITIRSVSDGIERGWGPARK